VTGEVLDRMQRIRTEMDECAEWYARLVEEVHAGRLQLMGMYEVAEFMDVAYKTVTMWKHRGKLPAPVAELRGATVWLRQDIERWAAERKAA